MIVDDFHIVSVAVLKAEAEAQLSVDIDSVESLMPWLEPVQAKAGQAQLLDRGRSVEQFEQAGDLARSRGRHATAVALGESPRSTAGVRAYGHTYQLPSEMVSDV